MKKFHFDYNFIQKQSYDYELVKHITDDLYLAKITERTYIEKGGEVDKDFVIEDYKFVDLSKIKKQHPHDIGFRSYFRKQINIDENNKSYTPNIVFKEELDKLINGDLDINKLQRFSPHKEIINDDYSLKEGFKIVFISSDSQTILDTDYSKLYEAHSIELIDLI